MAQPPPSPVSLPPPPPSARTGHTLVAVLVPILVVCLGIPCCGYKVLRTYHHDVLIEALDSLRLPSQMHLVNQTESGDGLLCFEDFCSVTRRYSSPSGKQDTFEILSAVLRADGYHCTARCAGIDETGIVRISTWVRGGVPEIDLNVFSTTDPADAKYLYLPPYDPSRQVHADLESRT